MAEQRRSRRFEMRLPIRVVRNGGAATPASGETRNVSSGGVLFLSDERIDAGETIEYTIQLEGAGGVEVMLHCLGKVTRSEVLNGGDPCEVAATLERYEFLRAR